jgi:hypothetical protein
MASDGSVGWNRDIPRFARPAISERRRNQLAVLIAVHAARDLVLLETPEGMILASQ